MTWSTRELADLAGTTVNTIRHYHSLGLLTAPERRYNGYKEYRVHHLVRLIQLRRVVELGVPLAQVDATAGHGIASHDELRELDERVVAEIARLQRARSDIAALLTVRAPVDTPRGFEAIAADLSEPDRSLIHILTRLHDEVSMSRLKQMVADEPAEGREAFAVLPPDADEADRRRVVSLLGSGGTNWRSTARPWLVVDPGHRRAHSQETRAALAEIVTELYNSAQRDVLRRVTAAGLASDLREARHVHEPRSA
ncbi:MerR family transcriptional regulator [Agromyces salentinus]|uniref:MerR family transcriptional regulator n=1 Tax=Agromyces salentinus TaxID=269421 RepID=A0ABN2MS57_9MICO|nr:MerR family transcriptional regulator [Agromyces salentinus]